MEVVIQIRDKTWNYKREIVKEVNCGSTEAQSSQPKKH